MIVEMRTNYAGPRGTCRAGGKINLPRSEAEGLVKAGNAVRTRTVDDDVVEATKPPEAQAATEPDVEENATEERAERATRRRRRTPAQEE